MIEFGESSLKLLIIIAVVVHDIIVRQDRKEQDDDDDDDDDGHHLHQHRSTTGTQLERQEWKDGIAKYVGEMVLPRELSRLFVITS